MSESKKKTIKATRRAKRTRFGLASTVIRARVSVFRSLRHIYAQVIDDVEHKTVASSSSVSMPSVSGDKKAVAKAVGAELANRIKKLGIQNLVFDRGSFLYHGRVRELVEGLRENGIII